MNKYSLTYRQIEKDDPILEHLNYIANELAESNRLKRIELNVLVGKKGSPEFRKSLEDRAIGRN